MPNITPELYRGLFNESDVIYAQRAVAVRHLSHGHLTFKVVAHAGEPYYDENDYVFYVPPNQECAQITHDKSIALGVLWDDIRRQKESSLTRLKFRILAALLQPSQS
jgi:hypothetical protein